MYVSGIRSHAGASSERKIAIPRLIGMPMRRARAGNRDFMSGFYQ